MTCYQCGNQQTKKSMTKSEREKIQQVAEATLESPAMQKLIRAQMAASIAAGFEPRTTSLPSDKIAEYSLNLADEILEQVGL
jgi:hypothetical protein